MAATPQHPQTRHSLVAVPGFSLLRAHEVPEAPQVWQITQQAAQRRLHLLLAGSIAAGSCQGHVCPAAPESELPLHLLGREVLKLRQ